MHQHHSFMRFDPRSTLSMVAVGAVSDRHARLWLRTEVPGPFMVALWDRGGTVRTAVVADRRTPEADGTMALMLRLLPTSARESRFSMAYSHP
jgi:hypothetical protein